MEQDELKQRLSGVLAFPVTPYTADGRVDRDAARANASWLPDYGVSALVTPSGTGELFGLSPDECIEMVRVTVEAARGRVPVIAGVGYGPRVAADLARRAEEVGADGILVMPPYYAQPDPDGLIEYYREIASATRLGMMPYARAPVSFTPELMTRLISEIPNLVAFKDGRGDLRQFQRIRERAIADHGPDRLAWLAGIGDDMVGPYFGVGVDGFTSSLACFWPEAAMRLYELASSGRFDALAEYHRHAVAPIYEFRQRRGGFEVSVTKAAMDLLGHTAGPVRAPLANLTSDDRAELGALLQRLEVPTAADRLGAARGATVSD